MPFMQKQTVLVVDDVPQNLDVLCEVLQNDYRLKVALNGAEALAVARSADPPNLVLMDVMMPVMDGYEACKKMKEDLRTRNIPVVFVTARGEERDETYGFQVGAVDYITKPINPAVVKARVKTHLLLHNQNAVLEKKVAQRTHDLNATRLEIIHRLGIAAEYKDNETGMHILRMSRYCNVIALGMGMNETEATLLLNAAPMHDVGKIGIPDSILNKPGKLTPEEWKTMMTHTTIGSEIIGDHDYDLMVVAKQIALTHHEKWDGSGYPKGLSGENIPIEGRISAIADVFDALTSRRPYKEAWPVEQAREHILKERGKHFDPTVVDVFEACWDVLLKIRDEHRE